MLVLIPGLIVGVFFVHINRGSSAVLGRLMTHVSIGLMQALAFLPLRATRALGWAVGRLLFALIAGRRRVVLTNLALCGCCGGTASSAPLLTNPSRRRLPSCRLMLCVKPRSGKAAAARTASAPVLMAAAH